MLTKNIPELRNRADFHRKWDNITGGTYGSPRLDAEGRVRVGGCAVGCLSTPHRGRDIYAQIAEGRLSRIFTGGELYFSPTDPDSARSITQHQRLTEDFGLNSRLIRAIEGLFESQGSPEAKSKFLHTTAHAIPDGVQITCADVDAFTGEHIGVTSGKAEWDEVCHAVERRNVRQITKAFHKWLRNFSPEKKALAAAKIAA